MSKKKPTAPIPLTGVVTITTDGRTTLAMKASHRDEDIQVSTGTANCRPGDVYSEYEGARIALARLYGLDPFPKMENGSQEKGHWEKATEENMKKGSRVRVVAPYLSGDKYREGDLGVVKEEPNPGRVGGVLFDWSGEPKLAGCFPRELEVWVPDAPEEAKPQEEDKPQEAPVPEAPKPFTPSFQVGDIVRLGKDEKLFHPKCQGKVGKVVKVSATPGLSGAMYSLAVNLGLDRAGHQFCTEWPDEPAPLELLFRDPQKGGEKA